MSRECKNYQDCENKEENGLCCQGFLKPPKEYKILGKYICYYPRNKSGLIEKILTKPFSQYLKGEGIDAH